MGWICSLVPKKGGGAPLGLFLKGAKPGWNTLLLICSVGPPHPVFPRGGGGDFSGFFFGGGWNQQWAGKV